MVTRVTKTLGWILLAMLPLSQTAYADTISPRGMEFSKKHQRPIQKVITIKSPSTTLKSASTPSSLIGIASWYDKGSITANGERFNPEGHTCAHRTLPFDTIVRVTNLRSGRHITCRINDRGPFIPGRVIDLSRGAARQIGLLRSGVARVKVETLKRIERLLEDKK